MPVFQGNSSNRSGSQVEMEKLQEEVKDLEKQVRRCAQWGLRIGKLAGYAMRGLGSSVLSRLKAKGAQQTRLEFEGSQSHE